jgi:hypothetical protein
MIFPVMPTGEPTGETILSSLASGLSSQESREDSVRRDLTQRLKPICRNLTGAEFEALILKMTREQLRGERVVHGRTRPS